MLDYPPPVLIDYNETELDSSNTIQSLRQYMGQPSSGLDDRDLVLVVDAGSTYFQLPSSVFIHRHEAEYLPANAWSKEEYGGRSGAKGPRFSQKVFTGAAKSCALPRQDDACKSVPNSPVRSQDGKPIDYKYLDSGTVIGLVPDVNRILDSAFDKMENVSKGGAQRSQAGLITRVFGEQEVFRRSPDDPSRRAGLRSGWKSFINGQKTEKLRAVAEGGSEDTLEARKNHEYGLGLDYQSALFQSGADSDDDIAVITFENRTQTEELTKSYGIHMNLPKDIGTSGPPFRPALTSDAPEAVSSQSAMPYNSTVDDLPQELTWKNLPLAVHVNTASVPAILHLANTSSTTTNLITASSMQISDGRWRQLWFHPWARAMMRHHIRSSEGFGARHAAVTGGDSQWNMRGGKGGAWTVDGQWLDFGDVCRGYEDSVFADGMGEWGREGGGHPRCSKTGALLAGEGECEGSSEEPGATEDIKISVKGEMKGMEAVKEPHH